MNVTPSKYERRRAFLRSRFVFIFSYVERLRIFIFFSVRERDILVPLIVFRIEDPFRGIRRMNLFIRAIIFRVEFEQL